MSRAIHAEVTQEDIQEGIKRSCTSCPVARALVRATGNNDVIAGGNFAAIGNLRADLPPFVQGWIYRFDTCVDRASVQPIAFDLEFKEMGNE